MARLHALPDADLYAALELHDARAPLGKLKHALDPDGRLNPGALGLRAPDDDR